MDRDLLRHEGESRFEGDLTDPEIFGRFNDEYPGSGVFYLRSPDLSENSAFLLATLDRATHRYDESGLPVMQGFQRIEECEAAAWKYAVRPLTYPDVQDLGDTGADYATAHFWLPEQENRQFEDLMNSLCSGSDCDSPGEFCGGDLPKLCRCCPTPGGLHLCR